MACRPDVETSTCCVDYHNDMDSEHVFTTNLVCPKSDIRQDRASELVFQVSVLGTRYYRPRLRNSTSGRPRPGAMVCSVERRGVVYLVVGLHEIIITIPPIFEFIIIKHPFITSILLVLFPFPFLLIFDQFLISSVSVSTSTDSPHPLPIECQTTKMQVGTQG